MDTPELDLEDGNVVSIAVCVGIAVAAGVLGFLANTVLGTRKMKRIASEVATHNDLKDPFEDILKKRSNNVKVKQ